jgi:hypothetical protein
MDSKSIDKAGYASVLNSEEHIYNQFNRFRIMQGLNFIVSPFAYIFFTKPDLNFSNENLANDPSLFNLSKDPKGIEIMKNLTCSPFKGLSNPGQGFIKLLTNMAENFDNSDISFRTDNFVETFRGYKMQLPIDDIDSTTVGNFSINYTEIFNLPITLLHKTWLDYIRGLRFGNLKPSDYCRKNRIIDFMCSVFYFELAEDNRHIEYYSKFTGVFPLNVPYSAYSWSVGEAKLKRLSIQYAYNFKEDLNPEILEDFRQLTSSTGNSQKPYNFENNWADKVNIDINKKILYFN